MSRANWLALSRNLDRFLERVWKSFYPSHEVGKTLYEVKGIYNEWEGRTRVRVRVVFPTHLYGYYEVIPFKVIP